MELNKSFMQNGVLPSQWIRKAIEAQIISASSPISDNQIQPNSLDLRIGRTGYQVRCSFLPGKEGINNKLKNFKDADLTIPDSGILLHKNQPYLFRLSENVNLPNEIYGRANPKSTTGRLDIFTRVVTDNGMTFDDVPHGYKGALYLEVVPRSFGVVLRPNDSLAQIRFQTGNPSLTDDEIRELLKKEEIVLGPTHERDGLRKVNVHSGITLSVGLSHEAGITIGFQARKNTPPIDLQAIGKAKEEDHWDRIIYDKRPVILQPEEFYLFRSRERVRLPPKYCAEMLAFDASSGELRTHYAGFFDSGFGYEVSEQPYETASAIVLEVRSRDVPFLIEDNQPIFRVNLLRCTEEPDVLYSKKIGSNYQSQSLRLPKQFRTSDKSSNYYRTQMQLPLN